MIYTAIDTFYLTDEQLKDSPSRKDGIDEETETTLRIYGCDLIQESGILLRLPQVVMATGQVLFHRFFCKKSFAKFSAKRVAASCVWLASKLEENPRKPRHVVLVFHRMECRRENLPIEHLDLGSKTYDDMKKDLIKTERHLLKEMGFVCHVEHPHKFISNYLATLEAPSELRQEAWNLANDSLRTTLCVRFKSEVVACGVIYAAARRFSVPLPEEPPWWTVFDADEAGVMEVCRVLAHLYSLPKAQYIPVFKDSDSVTSVAKSKALDSQVSKESPAKLSTDDTNTSNPNPAVSSQEAGSSSKIHGKAGTESSRELKKSDDEGGKSTSAEHDVKEDSSEKSKIERMDVARDRYDREKERSRGRDRDRDRDRDRERDSRSRDSDRESRGRDSDREREKERDRRHHHHSLQRSRDKGPGHTDGSRRQPTRDQGDYYRSQSSRDKDRHRRHP
ncbi:Cyclin family protein [Rhynchospora pubera]|uniref:Cyclin-L1-1 n=1 Tax=Rhynchospora pubera TaxID=906938 RepID=A0AAV8HP51_9POAL|nr:Cyclin family protein [Rhynchospora pubera]